MKKTGKVWVLGPDTAETGEWSDLLGKEMERYRIPAAVRKKTGLSSLSTVPDAWLIILCTPETKTDPEVLSGIREFIWAERYDHILTLLIRGKPEESFPEIMLREQLPDGSVVEHEPLAANITADTPEESRKKLKVEKLRLMAPMLGVSFDELRNRRQRQRMRVVVSVGIAVVLAAAAFLASAVTRMLRTEEQHKELSAQYSRIEEARAEARSQQDAASEHLADAVAVLVRDTGNDEQLRALLCMEFLLEYGQGSELPAILREAVTSMCAGGYAPAGRKPADGTEDEKAEEAGAVRKKISVVFPEDDTGKTEIGSFSLAAWSPEYRYAVYNCYDDGKNLTWISFPDHPDTGYFLQNEAGKYVQLTGPAVLSDGTLVGAHYFYSGGSRHSVCRYDPFRKEYLPLTGDRGEDPAPEGELPEGWHTRYAEETGVNEFLAFDGLPVIFGNRNGVMNRDYKGYDVYDRATMELLDFMEGVSNIREVNDTDLLLMETETGLICCRKDPFERIWTIQDGIYSGDPGKKTAVWPGGTGYLIIRAKAEDKDYSRAVYNLWTGEFLFSMDERGMEYELDISADKKVLCSIGKIPTVWDLETGEIFASVPGVRGTADFYGTMDPETGLRGSEAIAVGSYVYAYHPSAIPVPESLEELAALAEELIGGRKLTKSEREKYHLVHGN